MLIVDCLAYGLFKSNTCVNIGVDKLPASYSRSPDAGTYWLDKLKEVSTISKGVSIATLLAFGSGKKLTTP